MTIRVYLHNLEHGQTTRQTGFIDTFRLCSEMLKIHLALLIVKNRIHVTCHDSKCTTKSKTIIGPNTYLVDVEQTERRHYNKSCIFSFLAALVT